MLWKPVYGRLFFDADTDGGGGGNGGDKGDSGGANDGKDGKDAADANADAKDGKGKGKEFQPITSQDEFDDAFNRRFARSATKLRKDIEAEVRAQIAKDAETAEAAKKGDWQKIAEDRGKEIDDLKAQLATRDHGDLRRRVAAANKLPADAAERLKGTTEEELTADAKELAKLLGVREAPNTEAGSGTNGQSRQQQKQGGGNQQQNGNASQSGAEKPKVVDGVAIVPWPE